MNTFSKILAAGVLSVAALGGTAFAADNANSAFAENVRAHLYGTDSKAKSSGDYGYAGYKSGFFSGSARQHDVTPANPNNPDSNVTQSNR